MSPATISSVYKELQETLTPALGQREATAAARVILEDVRGITQSDIIVNGHRTVEDLTLEKIRGIAAKVRDGEPVQYAIGTARFYGMDFAVTPAVLIPRPETEGLVDMIVNDHDGRRDLRILDCGTGSGCIAIALARTLPFARVDAIDISDAALALARENASTLKVAGSVNFKKEDIMTLEAAPQEYDIIVSNPPYIAEKEAAAMDDRVKSFEPSTALFVPDDDPLVFYRKIATYAIKSLKAGRRIYFEINPLFADGMKRLLTDTGFADVDIQRDYIGRNRSASATKPTVK